MQAGGTPGQNTRRNWVKFEKTNFGLKIREIKANREGYYDTEQFPRGTRNKTLVDS